MSLIHDTSSAIQALRQLDNFGLAAMICDTSGTIQLLNPAASALFRQEPSKLEGQSIKDLEAFAPLVPLLESETPHIIPELMLLYDHLHCLVRMQRVGRVGYIFTFEDISEFKQREDRQALALDMVAHDLKAPISSIKGFAELVINTGELNDKQSRWVERIFRSLSAMEGLVRDLLDIRWLDSDENLKYEPVRLAYILERALETLSNHATKRQITIESHVEDGLSEIYADSRRIERVFANLIANAIKYTPVGGHVSVSLSFDGENQVIEVADNGIGIPEDYLPHIFKRFYRVPRENEVNEKVEGTGLGLAIVKTVVDRHQGDVTVFSELGKGSIFTVRLPIHPEGSIKD